MTRRGYSVAAALSSLVLFVAIGCGSTVTFDPEPAGAGGAGGAGGEDPSGPGPAGPAGPGPAGPGTTGQGAGPSTVVGTGVGGSSTTVGTTGVTTGVTTVVTTGGTTVATTVSTVGVGGMGPTSATVGVGGGGGSPLCPHGVCTEGPPLDPSCGPCEAAVCSQDPFCCQGFWDGLCVQGANQICNANCPFCPHDMCTTGAPLSPACDPCVAQVCQQSPACCSQAWGGGCIQLVLSVCNISC